MLKKKIYNLIKSNPKLYVIAKSMKDINNPELYMLLRGHYDYRAQATAITVRHLGELNQDKIIYYCVAGDDVIATGGFCALLRESLLSIGFAGEMGMTPVIKWGEHTHYYDQGMDKVTKNVFEYYFKPVSNVPCQEVMCSQNVVYLMRIDSAYVMKRYNIPITKTSTYQPNEEEIALLGKLYQKYIHLNEETKLYLEEEISKHRGDVRMLGVHIRGTDYKQGFCMHPVLVNPREHLEKAKELLEKGEYDKVFLATDDLNALKLFQNALSSTQLVYYDDVLRTEGSIGPHSVESTRALHHYKLGLEVIRDVYTLATCDGLIAGLSQVSFAARYINFALDRHFDDLVILDHGVNASGKEAPRTKKLKR